MKRRKKMTPEEWRAELERRADLDRRLLEMIERYRELNAKKRAAGSEFPRRRRRCEPGAS